MDYDTQYLKVLPAEILERDYGCGDPSAFVRPGDTVLDLGSGAGKICFIAAQIAGAGGKVIGVDFNDEMLGLAEQHREAIGEEIGFQNVEFRKGRIQDLRTRWPGSRATWPRTRSPASPTSRSSRPSARACGSTSRWWRIPRST